MADIYEQHSAAFANVSAYVLLQDGVKVGRVAIKRGARVTAYVMFNGALMTRGTASGGGYDKISAAVESAVGKLEGGPEFAFTISALLECFKANEGKDWEFCFEKHGIRVLRAV